MLYWLRQWLLQNTTRKDLVPLDRIQFVDSEFRIFGGFGWVYSSIMVDEPVLGRVRSSVFQDLGLGSAHFWLNKFEVRAFWRGSNGFEAQFW